MKTNYKLKRLSFLLLFLGFAIFSNGQTVLTQNFDATTTGGTSCTSVCAAPTGWVNATGDDKDWSAHSGSTSSSSTGPSGDHTSGSGKYMYTEASGCYNKVAYLVSPSMNFSSYTGMVMEFWYHMYGQNMGSLSVEVSTDNGSTWVSTPVWTISGQQQTSMTAPWTKATINLASYTGTGMSTVKVRFKGVTGTTFYSDMAIDDVVIYAPAAQAYVSSTTIQASTDAVAPGDIDKAIIGVEVVTTGLLTPFSVTQLNFSTTGTTSLSDIANAKVYYTGTNSNFDTTNQFGTTLAVPTATFNVTGTQSLGQGTNYFWLTYDIAATATPNNVVDAQCTQLTISGTVGTKTPTVTSPAGSRTIMLQKVIGNGSLNNQLPIYPYYGYTYSQSIYTPAQLGGAKVIDTLYYYFAGPGWSTPDNFQIYMGHTTKTAFSSSTDWAPVSTLTQVWTGGLAPTNNQGWVKFVLSTPFFYNGSDNLIIAADENTAGYHSSSNFFHSTSAPAGTSIRYYSDPTNPDPANPPSGTLVSAFPNIMIQFTNPAPMAFDTLIVEQNNNSLAVKGQENDILSLNVKTTGGLNAYDVTNLFFNTTGTTTLGDIDSAKVYYTGSSNTFAPTNLFGTVTTVGSNLAFTGTQTIANGDNYFWLTYYVDGSAVDGNFIDAGCDSVIVDSITHIPATSNPVGNRKIAGPYSGTYTLGNDSLDDFSSFNNAKSMLELLGVNGLVVINVDSGTYTEQLTLGTIPGASATNRVIFTAANHDSTSVTLQYAPTSSSNNWTLKFDGCEYITFKHMTIKTTGSSYGRVVQFSGANHNRLENNIIMSQSGATSGNFACIYNYNSLDEYNYIGHNRIVGGYYSLYMRGTSSSNLEKGNVVEYNEITDYYYYGAYNYYQDSITYKGNIVTNASNSGSVYGFHFYYCDASQIIGNQIYLDANYTHYGMYMYYCDSTATSRSLVANNMISTVGTGTSSHYGIYYNYGKGCDFVYNSLYNENGSSYTYNFRVYNSSSSYSGHRIYNNNFVNMGPGYAAYVYNNNYITGADNNNFYAPNNSSHLCYWGGYRTDLTALKAAYSGTNQNSVSTNANYFAWNDLHVNTPAINGMATPLSYITDDIDGDARTSTPDIGADEFVIINNDAGVTSLDAPIAPCPGTPANVMVTIKDFGLLSLVSATVNWEVNGVLQTPASFGGTIGNLADTMISLGNYTFLANTPYNIKVWTSSPNAVADQKTSNDTLFVNGMQTALSGGTYTIGPDTTDTWPSFTAANNALAANGVCGAIVINVDSGYYDENVSFDQVLGTSATNTITFKGLGNQTIVSNSNASYGNSYIFNFNGSKFFVLDSLTIQIDSNANYFWGVHFMNASDSNKVMNCTINCGNSTSSNVNGIVASGSLTSYSQNGNNANGLVIENNTINGGYYGITLRGSSSSNLVMDNHIKNNTLSGFYYYGIYNYYCDGSEISGNMINSGANTSNYAFAIYSGYSKNYTRITSNKIDMVKGSYGLYFYRHNYYSPNQDTALVANNMIHVADAGNGYGIYNYYSKKIKYLYNSVNMTGNKPYSRAMYIYSSSSSGLVMKNNIFANNANGYAIYSTSYASNYENDYNNLYTSGSNFAYQSGSKTNLAAWQTATSDAANSVSIDPEFFTDSDLHTYSIAMADKGTPVSVTTDYDGTTRSTTTPDVGADEYTTPANNLGVVNVLFDLDTYCGTNDSLYIVVKNFGTATQTNVPVSFVGTTPSGALSLSGVISSIASLQIDTVYMGMLNATVGGTYTANAYCTLSTDTSTYNDTMSVTGDVYIPEAIGYGDDFSTWPPMHWDVNGNGTFAWKHHSSGAAYADFWNVSTGACEMLSPTVVIPTTATSYLGFSYAYTGQYIASYADTLQVYAKACGDANWTLLWEKGGSDLVTPGGGATSPGTYLDANVVIPSSMQGSNVQIMFRGVTDYGPNLYLNDMSVFTAPAVALGADTAVCSGDTITLDAGTFIGAKYLWTRGLDTLGTTQTLDATSTGSYIAHVSQYGIAGTDAININVNPLPTLNVMGLATSYCENEAAATLSAIPAGGTFTGNGVIGNDFDPALAGLGNQDITYAYTDMNGCSNTAMVSTMVKAAPVITTSGNVTVCEGTSTTLTASVPTVADDLFFSEYIEGSSNNKALEIYNGTGDTVYLANYQIAQAVNGNGWAYYHTFPAGAYILDGDVWVMVANQISATYFDTTNADEILSYPSVCHFTGDDARALIKLTATDTTFIDIIGDPNNDPGSGWDVAGVSHATKNHSLIRKPAVVMGDTSWTNVAGTDSLSSQYMVYPQNTFSFLGSHTMTGPANYMWSTMDNTPSTVVSPVSTTDYYVTVTGANACDNVDTLTVDVLAAPMVALGADQALCASETLSLDAGAGIDYTYMWNNGDTTQMINADSTGIGVATGNYSVVVTDSNTCMGYDTIALTFMAEPMVTIMGSDTVKMSWNASFDAGTGFSTYLWSNGWTNQTVLFGSNTLTPGDTTIDVQVTNANGCYGYDTITFYVLDDVGFGDNNLDMNLEVYPNPSNGQFTMAISGFTGELDMNIVDLSGKVITTKQLDVTSNFAEKFDVSDLAKGVYYIKLISKDGVKVEKLIIQ